MDTGEDLCNFYLISDTVYAPVQGTMTYTNATHYNLYNVTHQNQYRPSLYTAVLPLQTLTVYSCPSSTDPHRIQLSFLYRPSLYTAVLPLQTLTVWLANNPNYTEITNWYTGWKNTFDSELLAHPLVKGGFR